MLVPRIRLSNPGLTSDMRKVLSNLNQAAEGAYPHLQDVVVRNTERGKEISYVNRAGSRQEFVHAVIKPETWGTHLFVVDNNENETTVTECDVPRFMGKVRGQQLLVSGLPGSFPSDGTLFTFDGQRADCLSVGEERRTGDELLAKARTLVDPANHPAWGHARYTFDVLPEGYEGASEYAPEGRPDYPF